MTITKVGDGSVVTRIIRQDVHARETLPVRLSQTATTAKVAVRQSAAPSSRAAALGRSVRDYLVLQPLLVIDCNLPGSPPLDARSAFDPAFRFAPADKSLETAAGSRSPASMLGPAGMRERTCLTKRAVHRKPRMRRDFDVLLTKGNGARRARTADLLTASQTLSQLSYGPLVPSKSRDSSLSSSARLAPS